MEFIFVLVIVMMSIVIHELAHGYAALSLGDKTAQYAGRLTLNPISHIDPFGSIILPLMGFLLGGVVIGWAKPVPYNPYNLSNQRWGEALVAIAGPAANLLLVLIFGLLIRFSSDLGLDSEIVRIASQIVILNIVLAIFNLMPVPPLDGSKVLFSLLPLKWTSWRQKAEQWGFFLVLFFVLTLWKPIILPIVDWIFTLLTGLN